MDILKSLGIGQKSSYQKKRDASPVLSALSQRRQPTFEEIQEQERLNRASGVTFPRYQGNVSLRAGEKLRNIGGLTYVVPADPPAAPINTTGIDLSADIRMPDKPIPPMFAEGMGGYSQGGMFSPPVAPSVPPQTQFLPGMPVQQEIVPEQGRENVTIDVVPVRPNTTLPDIPVPLDIPVPVRTEVTPQVPETSLPTRIDMSRPATVAKPDLDSILDNLLARTAGITDAELPVPSAGAFTPKMTKSVVPSRAAGMDRGTNIPIPPMPDMSTPDIQPYLPDMFRGRLPMPEPTQYASDPLGIEGIPMQTSPLAELPLGTMIDEQGNLVNAQTGAIITPNYQPDY